MGIIHYYDYISDQIQWVLFTITINISDQIQWVLFTITINI